jgi:Flp pilus assembly protein TadB
VIPGLLVALATWCLVPEPASVRARRVLQPVRTPRRLDPALAAALLAPLAAVLLLGVPMGLLAGAVLAPLAHRQVGRLESGAARRRAALVRAALPGALDLMVAALEVGRPPVTAFALAAEATSEPLGPELSLVAGRLAIAADADTVWQALATDPALAPVARAFRRAAVSGMPVAHVVSGVAEEMRRERSAMLRERSRKVAVRTAAPLGACFLPAFFLIGIVPTVLATFRTFSW